MSNQTSPEETVVPAVRMTGVSHSFGHVQALRGVDFEVAPGEIMALLGENGAGKSTLVKVLAGLLKADAADVEVEGEPTRLGSPRNARAAGIALAAQELSVIGSLSAAENIFLGSVPFSGPRSVRRMAKAARPFLDAVGLEDLDPRTPVEKISVAERQLVEIARLLAGEAKIFILDEPTAALSDREIERVKRTIRGLADRGLSVVYVTHRLGEVFEIANRVTILRNGESTPPRPISSVNMDSLIEAMIGRPLEDMFPARAKELGDVALTVDGMVAPGLAHPISLDVRAGEIVGLAGLLGSGASTVIRGIAGAQSIEGGEVKVGDEPLPPAHSFDSAIHHGISYCSADRKYDGVFANLAIYANLSAPALGRVSRYGWMQMRGEQALAKGVAERFAIDPTRLPEAAGTLSGGNQQKVALGKWLATQPKVLLVEEPTRGVDVGARAEIYGYMRTLADEGLAIVFASTDLDEVLGLSDTVVTLYRGEIVAKMSAEGLSQRKLLADITNPEAATAVAADGGAA
jgi:ABC-type sugar transport system ATPase subunit